MFWSVEIRNLIWGIHWNHANIVIYLYCCVLSCSLMANSLQNMDCNLPDFSICGIFQARNTGVGCHFLLHGIFVTQGFKLHPLHWQADSLTLSHLGRPLYFSPDGTSSPEKISHRNSAILFPGILSAYLSVPMFCLPCDRGLTTLFHSLIIPPFKT